MIARPEQLTDLQRESQEEAQDRLERVQAATLQLATALVDMAAEKGTNLAAGAEGDASMRLCPGQRSYCCFGSH